MMQIPPLQANTSEHAFSRRTLLRIAGVGAVTVASIPTLAGCATGPAALTVAGNVAAQLAIAIAATEIATWLHEPLAGALESWNAGIQKTQDALIEEGRSFFSPSCYNDSVPPAIFFSSSEGEKSDTATDRLIVAVNEGADSVTFDPWAWQALFLFIDELTKDKSGDDLAGYRALCRISLIPSAIVSTNSTTESGRSTLLSYKTRNGEVEMNRRTSQEGATEVQVVATGIPVANGSATTRAFVLPSKVELAT